MIRCGSELKPAAISVCCAMALNGARTRAPQPAPEPEPADEDTGGMSKTQLKATGSGGLN